MKSILIAVSSLLVFACASFAANAPDNIQLKKNVMFPHKIHADLLKDCTKCHKDAKGSKIEGFGREWAHKECKGCHTAMQKGPTSCKQCHK